METDISVMVFEKRKLTRGNGKREKVHYTVKELSLIHISLAYVGNAGVPE